MTSVEKRRSSRKSGGHRKHSDSSSGGSFLDETDREVSSLTDRAFRSLCIGEEAVYNDSDLSLSSPSIQRDRQLAFSQERDWEERKRAAHENFSLRVQQYGQDWILGGMCGAEVHEDPQWQDYGARMQGMVSATFQHSLVETSQQGNPLSEGELSFFSNGATELSSQQRRSHSRVSSLVRAFNSEGHRDEAGMENYPREWSDGTGWDRSALISIQRELSELSTSYQQNFDNHHFPSANLFSPQDTGFYSTHGMAQMSQVRPNMSAQVSCNSNFFMHSEFSPFKLWREHNRFPFQQGDVSGFMQRSEFPRWYNTPMYNELSLENQSNAPYRDLRHSRNHLGLTAPLARSTSTSTVLQKASAMEKRCESELAGHYPHRKWTQSLGANKLPSQRPSTASPTTEMSRRVRDTISSVKALQQKMKMMSEQNVTTDVTANQINQGGLHGHERLGNHGNSAVTLEANVASTSRLLSPSVQWEAETLNFKQHEVSPQPVEHPPVRAGSRGGTPDIRMSSYKSRATSLLFNLKDNRKRVKSTYSPTKFKGLEIQEKQKHPSVQPAMEIPVFTDQDIQETKRTAVNHHHNPGLSLTAQICQPEGVNLENIVGDYQTVQAQGQMVHHAGFSGFIPENYTNYQLANGQNPHENVASFTPHKRDYLGSTEQLQQSDSATDASRLNTGNSHSREYLRSQANSEQAFNETVGGVFSKVERYEQMRENKQIYESVSSQDKWRQVSSQEMENFSVKPALFQSKQELLSGTSGEEIQSGRDEEKTGLGGREQEQEGQQEQKNKEGSLTQNYDKSFDQDHRKQVNLYPATETQNPGQVKQHTSVLKEDETQTKANQKGEIPEEAPAQTRQIQNKSSVDSKDEDVTAKHKEGQTSKAEENQHKVQVEQPKGEMLDFTSDEKTIKIEESKPDPTKTESLRQTQEEIKEEKKRGEQEEEFIRKEPEMDGEKETKIIQQFSDEADIITEKVGREHTREEQVKAERTETEKLKEEHVQIRPAKSEEAEMVRSQQADMEEATGERIKPEEMEEKQITTENTKAEQTEDRKTQQVEEMKETQNKTEHMKEIKGKAIEAERGCVISENVRQLKDVKDSRNKGEMNTHKAEILAKETKDKQEKVEENQQELSKSENLKDRSEKLTAKLTAAQPVRKEPDRVEQVKSELAKAKAELAKIKEKMRGDQKEKVKNNPAVKEDEATKNKIHFGVVSKENKDGIKQGELDEMPTLRDAKDYGLLREKYGFTDAAKTNHTTPGSLTTTHTNKAEVTSLKEAGTGNNETNKNEPSLVNADTGNKEEVLVSNGEPSKEFKLSSINSVPTGLCSKVNGDSVVDESKDDRDQTSAREKRDSDVAKLNPLERKAESNEQTTGPAKELPVTSQRVLLHKERAQTKQEILTSRIKAHAEKEISAIREKGLTLREGFIGKGSTKHLASGQSANIRQKPPSQEAFNNVPIKHQMEHSRLEPAKFEPVPSSVTVKSATTNDQFVEHTANSTSSIIERNVQTEVGMKSQLKSKEHEKIKNNPVKEQDNPTDVSGRQKELQQANMREILGEKTKDQTEAAGVKAANSKFQTTNHDSESLSVVIGQKDTTVTNDNLEIMGIMVTIRERNPLMNTDLENNSPGKQNSSAEQEFKTAEAEKGHPRQEESTCSIEVSKEKEKEENKTDSVVKEDPAEVVKDNSIENVQETFILETEKRDVIEKVTDKRTNLQENSSANVEPQRELFTAHTKDKELTEMQSDLFKQDTNVKEAKCIMTKSVKDNLVQSSEEMKRDEEKSHQEIEKSQINKTSTTKLVNSDINIDKHTSIDGQSGPLPEEKLFSKDSTENEKLLSNIEQSKEANQDANVHIDTIAIRVVPSATEEDNLKMAACREEKAIDECCLKPFPSASSEQKRKESLEDKLAVQYVLSSVRKLADSLKASSKPDRTNACKSEHGGPESNAPPEEGGYFQVQGVAETSNRSQSNATTAEDEIKEKERPAVLPNKTSDGLNQEVFVFTPDQTENKASLGKDQEEDIQRTNQEKEDNLGSKQTDGSQDRQCVTEGRETDQHNQSHRKDNQPNSSSMEKLILRESRSTKLNSVPQKPEAKLKPKGRVSTIPEISAIADYARLKVIVSEDKEDTAPQDFPPNKKDGFFPLIQTRPSRRPVFSDNPNELLVKDRKLPSKTEISTKMNKEPKEIVFPITEKEHQRTGMFKLGGKDRPGKIVSDSNMDAGPKENVEIDSSRKETNKSPTAQTGTKRLDPSTSQSKYQAVAPTELTDKKLLLRANLGQKIENTTQPEKDERPEAQQTKDTKAEAEDGGTSRLKKQNLSNWHEETKTKQQGQKQQWNDERMLRHEKKKGEEDTKIKHMLEESRASLAEEQRKASRREEERRAKEREAVNIMIKERREKQRQSEVRAGEEIKSKQREELKVVQRRVEVHGKQKREDTTESAERKLIKNGDEKVFKVGEDDTRGLKQQEKVRSAYEEHQRRTAKEEQKKAANEREQRRPVQEEQQRRTAKEEQRRYTQVEQQRRLAQGEQRRKSIHEEQQTRAALEEEQRQAAQEKQKRRAAQESQKRTTAEEEKMRTAQIEYQRRLAQQEQRRKSAHDQQQSKSTEEEHKIRTSQEEQQSGAAQEEQHRGPVHVEQQKRAAEEEQRRAAQIEQQRRLAQDEQRRKSAHEEQQRRAALVEQQQRASHKEQQRKFVQVEQQQKTVQAEQARGATRVEQQNRAAHVEQQIRAAHLKQQNRTAYIEQHNKTAHVEQQNRAAHIEQQSRAPYVEQHNRAAYMEQHHKAAHVEQNNRAAIVVQQHRAPHIEQQNKTMHIEHQNRAAHIEQQNIAACVEQQNRAAHLEQQNRDVHLEQENRAAHVEQQNIVARVEHENRAAHIEQQNRAAHLEQQNRAAHLEQQNRAAHVEQQNRAAHLEQQNRAARVEHENRAAHIEQQNRTAHLEQQNRDTHAEQQIRFAQVEQQNRAAHVEQQIRAVQEEMQIRAVEDEQQHKVAEDKHELRAAQGERQSRGAHVDEQTQLEHGELQRRAAEEEQKRVALLEQQIRLTQDVQMMRSEHEEQKRKGAQETEQRRAAQEEKQRKVMEEQLKQAEQEKQQRRAIQIENHRRVLLEQQKQAIQKEKQKSEEEEQQKQWGAAQTEKQNQTKQINDQTAADVLKERERKPRDDERAAIHPEEKRIKQTQEQKSEELMEERHIKEQWTKTPEGLGETRNAQNEETIKQKTEKTENAIFIGRNEVAQELVQTKKDNNISDDKRKEHNRSAFHKENPSSVQIEMQHKEASKSDALQYYAITSIDTERKPKESQLLSPVPSQQNQLVSESSDDSLSHTRTQRPHSAASPGSSLPRSNTSSPALGGKPLMFRVKDNTMRGSSLTKSVKPRFHKNFGEDFWMGSPSERAEDEQEMLRRSAGTPVISDKGLNRSASSLQDYATSFSHQRPYSRRSLALDEDESRSVISNMSEDVESIATNATDVADFRGLFDYERPESACSFSSDVSRSLGKPPVVPPKSEKALRRAQRLTSRRMKKELSKAGAGSPAGVVEEVSSLPSSTEVCSSNHHAVASPHFSPPIAFAHAPALGSSLSSSQTEHQSSHHSFHASPHATGPISLPISSSHAVPTVSLPPVSLHASVPTAPTTVAHVSSSSISHLINPHSTPVTQYQVEPSHYHQSYPLTQHKVLQDLGSGQYFVVEVPVQVKTKTFFDPETGKYVQLNVRQSGQNVSQPQPQSTYSQRQLQPQMKIKSQQQHLPQGSITGKPFVFYQGYPSYPQSYQSAVINSANPNRSTALAAFHQDQQHPRESHVPTEVQQNSEEHRYSPEKTPYMDTVNEINRTHNPINSTQDSCESFPQFETNSERLGGENQPRDIIAMSDLEDFMEISDW